MLKTARVKIALASLLSAVGTAAVARGDWLEVRKLLGTSAGDHFASAVALDGDRLAVGAPDDEGGFVYLFERNAGGPERWGKVARLTSADARVDNVGGKVALDGDRLIAGGTEDVYPYTGLAVIFERQSDGTWQEVATLTRPPDPDTNSFGNSVAVEGDTVFVGAADDGESGAVWVYERQAGGPGAWGLVAKLTGSQLTRGALLGWSAAVDAGILAVGAYHDDEKASWAGAVQIFERDPGGTWIEGPKLTASGGKAGDGLGESVGVSGSVVVSGGVGVAGAYVFERDESGVWGEVARLTPSDLGAGSGSTIGEAVAIFGDLAVVGAKFAETPDGVEGGAAYLFEHVGPGPGDWVEVAKLTASDADEIDALGSSVAAGTATVVAGALADADAGFDAGSAYVFLERQVGLGLAGSCPGPITLTVTGATPLGPVAVFLGAPGMTSIPVGPCTGSELGLGDPHPAGGTVTDLAGNAAITRALPPGACGRSLQAIDLATCALSAATPIP